MNDYPQVGFINILPNESYISTNFLMTINLCTDDYSPKENLEYKFTYVKKKSDVVTGPQESSEEIVIKDWSNKSETLFFFNKQDLNQHNKEEGTTFYVKGYCRDELGVYYSEEKEVKVYDIPTESGKNLKLNDTLKAIDVDLDLTPEQLSYRAEELSTTTVDYPKKDNDIVVNRTNITDFTKEDHNWTEKLNLLDPDGRKPHDIYCNRRGDSYIIYYYLTCDCRGYYGTYCQIDQESQKDVISFYYKIFNQVKSLQTEEFNHHLLNAVHLLVKSAATFFPVENVDFFYDVIEYINLYMNKFVPQMTQGNDYETYFDIYNYLVEYGLNMVNQLKYKYFIENHSKKHDNLYDNETFRNATLSHGEKPIAQDYLSKIKSSIQSLLEFYASNNKPLRFINRNLNVYVAKIDKNFDCDEYFNIEKYFYEPWIRFKKCLDKTMIESQGNPDYEVYMTAIVWKVNPYMNEWDLYWDTSTPTITLKFIDNKGKKIFLTDCGGDAYEGGDIKNMIELYFPVYSYLQIDTINRLKKYLSPENQFPLDSDIFNDPVYINASGAVDTSSPEERQHDYFVGFNFSCKYYQIQEDDHSLILLSNETLDYHLYTKEHYIQCITNSLKQEGYSEFVVNQYIIPADFHITSRFFYLKHYQLLLWSPNYSGNPAFYFYVIMVSFYFLMIIAYVFIERNFVTKMARMDNLKTEVARLNMPYREEYIFNNDLQIEQEMKTILSEHQPKPDNEEMNLDINNVNAEIIADEISKYTKGKRDNETNIDPKFFIKSGNSKVSNYPTLSKSTAVSSKFFPDLEDKKKALAESDNELMGEEGGVTEENPELKRKKMKKLFSNDFRGLSTEQPQMNLNNNMRYNDLSRIQEEENDNDKSDIINNNKEIISEEVENKSISKRSKRSRKSKKNNNFFKNPPKKQPQNESEPLSNIIFTDKERKKIATSNSTFFASMDIGNNTDKNSINDSQNKHKNKHKTEAKNVFQQGFTEIYKPNFSGPKVVSENLSFFKNYKPDLMNDEVGNGYFSSVDRKLNTSTGIEEKISTKKKVKFADEKRNPTASMKVGFSFKERQIDLNEGGAPLPPLAEKLTLENRMLEFFNYGVYMDDFYARNIKNRYILITTFCGFSILYSRYQRVGNFVGQLSLYALILSIMFTADKYQEIMNTKEIKEIFLFVGYCLIAEVGGCILIHIPAYCFWVSSQKLRNLYTTVRNDGGINVIKQAEEVTKKGRILWKILGVVIQWIYIILGFYFSFGFCATYPYQKGTFIVALGVTIGFDIILGEFLWELVICLLYYHKDIGRCLVFFGTVFNLLRNINHLV